MCGICGALGSHIDRETLESATALMRHRGPDGAGYFLGDGVALGMRRLSIIDLAGGQQPKTDESGRIQVIFNGEIYNFRELRDELETRGHVFLSHSDTEVIAHGYEEWGTRSFERLNGIFAIAIWDGSRGEMVLARDHLGIKPLYYAANNSGLIFASELTPLVRLLGHRPSIDQDAVALYLRYRYVPEPRSIFEGVNKLPPAHLLIASAGRPDVTVRRFWDPLVAAAEKEVVSSAEAEELVDAQLAAAVKRQLVSDVPLGAFLSGGIDSSAVVAMMQRAGQQTKTFSIGFTRASHDESRHAADVAHHLGTEHHEWIISEAEALAVVPELPRVFDEPFGDPSAIPTYLVSQLARRQVTVTLSGDGGDELFGGYTRYRALRRASPWWNIPEAARSRMLGVAGCLPGRAGRNARHHLDVLGAPRLSDAYRNMVAAVKDRRLHAVSGIGDTALVSNAEWPAAHFESCELSEAMMLTDLVTYLPGDILTKVDRASMAHSLEARVPLLDPWFVELVLSLPIQARMGAGPKSLLRSVLSRYVPRELFERPKKGFGVPLPEWLRGTLRPYLDEYLSEDALMHHRLIAPEPIQALVREHMTGTRNWDQSLWALLMFQIWYHDFYCSLGSGTGAGATLEAATERA